MTNTSYIFLPGKITFLLDAPAGSSGKGKLAAFVTKHADNVKFLVTSNSLNASHTVIDTINGKDYNVVFKALPSGSLYHEKLEKVFITSGAIFDIPSLLKEIEIIGIPREKVRISPRAGIATEIDAAYERGECDLDGNYHTERQAGTLKTGTTASGSGAVLAKKVLRHKTLKTANDFPEIADMIGIVEEEILDLIALDKSGLFEIGQGFPLSNNYWRFAPHTTSRNVTVSAALNDAFLPPSIVGNVVINTRTFPIRINSKKYISKVSVIPVTKLIGVDHADLNWEVACRKLEEMGFGVEKLSMDRTPNTITALAGKFLTWEEVQSGIFEYEVMDSYSGDWYPDQEEITWEDIERDASIQIPQVVKNTTLTKLPRRVATFSKINLDEAIKYNQTNHFIYISVNFINFVDGEMEGVNKQVNEHGNVLTEKAETWMKENIIPVTKKYSNVMVSFIGTSEKTDDYVS